MPIVSAKAFVIKFSYILMFYFGAEYIFDGKLNSFIKILKNYIFSLLIVIFYMLYAEMKNGYTRNIAGFACFPFYNDHTIISASLVFILPIVIYLFLIQFKSKRDVFLNFILFCCVILIVIGIYYSFCRAAWLSIILTIPIIVSVLYKIKIKYLLLFVTIFFSLFLLFRSNFISYAKRNRVDSNVDNAGLYEHVFSLTNITTDVSNKERINRWRAGWYMFLRRPIFGYGSGTYQFKYFPYQKADYISYLSIKKPLALGSTSYNFTTKNGFTINKDFKTIQGSGGTAHSEYILHLSENGILITLLFIIIIGYSLVININNYYKTNHKLVNYLLLTIITSQISFYIHIIFNNYLDDCKVSFLFWLSILVSVKIDLLIHKKMHKSFPYTLLKK